MAFTPVKMQAEIRVPQEGFTLDDLKTHMRDSKIPLSATLRPAIVTPVSYANDDQPDDVHGEVAFLTEWSP